MQRYLKLFSLFSSTLLSTMQLNKLLHLILSALVYEDNNLFDRAMLFLYNQKTHTLQGMLGLYREDAASLKLVTDDPGSSLTGYWDIDAEAIKHQMQSDFCINVRRTRIDLSNECQIISVALHEHRVSRVEDINGVHCRLCDFISQFGVSSFAAVPLAPHKNLIGVIIVDNPLSNNQPITDQQVQVLQLFADQSGMAIENTRLFRELEEAHAELRDARQRLVHGSQLAAIGEMAASISHELKTPLITIGGFAARLGRMMPLDTPQRHYLDTIINESHRLERLLGDILTFSRKPTICFQPFDLKKILLECLADYAVRLGENSVKLETNLPEGRLIVLGDANQIKQVCINLFVNALEVMPNGGKLIVSLSVTRERGRPSALITISDTGGGIPEDLISKIFTPFFTTKRHGTGLGLAIVNRIVQNHCGTLNVRNINQGAEFQIILPLAADEEPAV